MREEIVIPKLIMEAELVSDEIRGRYVVVKPSNMQKQWEMVEGEKPISIDAIIRYGTPRSFSASIKLPWDITEKENDSRGPAVKTDTYKNAFYEARKGAIGRGYNFFEKMNPDCLLIGEHRWDAHRARVIDDLSQNYPRASSLDPEFRMDYYIELTAILKKP